MSPNAVNDLATSFVQMARAFEELPQVQSALEQQVEINDSQTDTIQRLEIKLMDAKNLEGELRQSIRDLEVARDDAELRFLEADDKAQQVVKLLGQIAGHAAHAEAIIIPPKPNSTPTISEVKPIAVDPTSADTSSSQIQSTLTTGSTEYGEKPAEQGQSDPLPTSALATPTGTGTESVTSDTDPEPPQYTPWGTTSEEWYEWRDRQPRLV